MIFDPFPPHSMHIDIFYLISVKDTNAHIYLSQWSNDRTTDIRKNEEKTCLLYDPLFSEMVEVYCMYSEIIKNAIQTRDQNKLKWYFLDGRKYKDYFLWEVSTDSNKV